MRWWEESDDGRPRPIRPNPRRRYTDTFGFKFQVTATLLISHGLTFYVGLTWLATGWR